jgi:hypothetical protein
MTTPLRPCPGCSRHVRASESACPFCGGELDAAFRSAPSPRAPVVGRLSRAALFAIGAGGVVVACGSGSGSGGDSGVVTPAPPYGAFPITCATDRELCEDSSTSDAAVTVEAAADGAPDAAAGDGAADSGGDVQPPPGDTGDAAIDAVADADSAADVETDPFGVPAYGCPPLSCETLAAQGITSTCAPQSDGCGNIVGPCGTNTVCISPEYCGGGGFNQCGAGDASQEQ